MSLVQVKAHSPRQLDDGGHLVTCVLIHDSGRAVEGNVSLAQVDDELVLSGIADELIAELEALGDRAELLGRIETAAVREVSP